MKFLTILGLAAACAVLVLPASAQQYGRPDRFDDGRPRQVDNGGRNAGRLLWSGTVDDTAIVTLRGDQVQTRTVSGNGVRDVRSDVQGRLPNRPVNVRVRREQGRGEVEVVQEPAARNGYTTRIRIHDPQGGSGRYAFTVMWGGGGRYR